MSVTERALILAVDDSPANLALLTELLEPTAQVLAATSGDTALRVACRVPQPDLILLDVMMPDVNGYETFAALRADPATCRIPVIFLTALSDPDDELRGLELGAVDYLTKPIVAPLLLARVRNQLELKRARDRLGAQNDWLTAEVERRMADNDLTQLVAIRALAHLAETRDPETGNHILRTQAYVAELAQRLTAHPRDAARLDPAYVALLTRSAPLHDIGKVGIPDAILLKPGRLNAAEWEIMKTHARIGADAIAFAQRDAQRPVAFLDLAKEIARWHHERWDGSGYPDGLAGEAIPLSARIMAIADVFDALISRRVYKAPMPPDEAREIIAAGSGSHFDPLLAATFLDGYAAFVAIAERYHDDP